MYLAVAAEADGFFGLAYDFLTGEVVRRKPNGQILILTLIWNVESELAGGLLLRVAHVFDFIIEYWLPSVRLHLFGKEACVRVLYLVK